MGRIPPRAESATSRSGRRFDRRIGQYAHLMAPPDEFGGETHGRRHGPSAVDHRQQEPGTAMPQMFGHQRPALARSGCAALTIGNSSTMTISSPIGVAQQAGAEPQRAFVVAREGSSWHLVGIPGYRGSRDPDRDAVGAAVVSSSESRACAAASPAMSPIRCVRGLSQASNSSDSSDLTDPNGASMSLIIRAGTIQETACPRNEETSP